MKQFFVLIFMTLAFVCEAQIYIPEEVLELNDLLYKKKDTTLITGKVITHDGTGKIIIEEVNIREGIAEGMTKLWYENGTPQFETNIKNGQPNGIGRMWYKNGQLKVELLLKNGEPEGRAKEWYENGQLKREGQFANGKQNGIFTFYNKVGAIEKKEYWENGVLKSE